MKHQPSFDFDWFNDEQPAAKTSRPHDSAIFVAYIKQVAPQLITSDHPIHKTPKGYATNNSAYSDIGQFEIDSARSVIIHRHKVAHLVGNKYEYGIEETLHRIEFKEDRAVVH